MAMRDYVGPGITVHWDAERCIHSERCVAGAPSVFDKSARPWVDVTGASADKVADVIDTCPSGALSYTRTDGAPNGRRGYDLGEDPASATAADGPDGVPVGIGGTAIPSITPELDGPLVVMGPLALIQPDGTTRVLARTTLCRCGQSSSKPFCDGSHEVVGFRAPGVGRPYG
jgi:uncharacterized Fe-S cluster protein YjdI